MPSEVGICNQALSWLGQDSILALDPNESNIARLCFLNYTGLRDAVLEEANWTFATRRYVWDLVQETPPYGYGAKFLIPSEVLVVIEADNSALFTNGVSDLDWRREEEYIVADATLIYAKCIVRIVNPAKFSSLFTQALTARIAAELSPPITESKTKTDQMWALYKDKMSTAVPIDGKQGKSDRIRGRSFTTKVR